jgi:hypothetical protein
MEFDCEAEINRLFVGSMYIFGFFTFFLLTISSGYTRMERYLSYRILDLEKKLEAYKRGVDTLSSSEESETESSSDSDSSEEKNSDEVIVDDRWEYSNTI